MPRIRVTGMSIIKTHHAFLSTERGREREAGRQTLGILGKSVL